MPSLSVSQNQKSTTKYSNAQRPKTFSSGSFSFGKKILLLPFFSCLLGKVDSQSSRTLRTPNLHRNLEACSNQYITIDGVKCRIQGIENRVSPGTSADCSAYQDTVVKTLRHSCDLVFTPEIGDYNETGSVVIDGYFNTEGKVNTDARFRGDVSFGCEGEIGTTLDAGGLRGLDAVLSANSTDEIQCLVTTFDDLRDNAHDAARRFGIGTAIFVGSIITLVSLLCFVKNSNCMRKDTLSLPDRSDAVGASA